MTAPCETSPTGGCGEIDGVTLPCVESGPTDATVPQPPQAPTQVDGAGLPTVADAGQPTMADVTGQVATADATGVLVADRYALREFLGDGAFSEVHAAWDVRLERRVAVKLVYAATGKRPTISRRRFLAEARTAARINHRNVVAVHDVGEHGDVPFLVMEVLDRSLKEQLASGTPLPPARLCRILAGVADGLAAAHAAGVVHCDVKPANVLLAADGTAKLGDFGIARTLDDATPHTLWNAGTPQYLAPERFSGSPATAASDVWAVGVIAYEALAGRRPFGDAASVVAGRLEPLGDAVPDLPASLVRLVSACLDPDPSLRPPATALGRALRHHARLPELQERVPAAERDTQPQPPPGSAAQRPAPPPAPPPPGALEVSVDPAWYAEQDVDDPCPTVGPPAVVVLDPAGVLVGRPSNSSGVRPTLDLGSDVGVSRRHCRFAAEPTPDGLRWTVEDLSSSNGTFVAAPGAGLPTDPIAPGVPRDLEVGSRIYLGAWTRLTVVPVPVPDGGVSAP